MTTVLFGMVHDSRTGGLIAWSREFKCEIDHRLAQLVRLDQFAPGRFNHCGSRDRNRQRLAGCRPKFHDVGAIGVRPGERESGLALHCFPPLLASRGAGASGGKPLANWLVIRAVYPSAMLASPSKI